MEAKKEKVIPMARKTYGKRAMKLPPLCGFDFETDGLGGPFIIGAFVTDDGAHRELFYTLQDCFDFIVAHPDYRYLAHNAVGYEFAYLYPYIKQYFDNHEDIEVQPTLQGENRIVQIKMVNKKEKICIDLRDTLCLFPMSLDKVAKAFCPDLPKLKEKIDFDKVTFDPANQDHIDYVFRDCDIVIEAYKKHASNMADVFGSPLGVTAGSTAIKAFYTTIPEGHTYYRVSKEKEDFFRKCYYGGLVLPGKEIGNWGAVGSVDVNGAYGYHMQNNVYPVGTPASIHRYEPGLVGFYHVIATVPPSVFETVGFNPIPCRSKIGLVWPTGTFETYISHVELAFGLENGCTFQVLQGYVFHRLEPVFKHFMDKCQEQELANGGMYKPSIKLNRNSCYGKFGSKTTHNKLVFSQDTVIGARAITNEKTGEIIEGLYIMEESSDADYMLPHWAALITAYERVYLMRFIKEAYQRGARNVYCDTDSIKCDLPVLLSMVKDGTLPMGNNYGQFKMEDICNEFIVLGPKCFYGTPQSTEEQPVIKAKGVPKKNLTKGLSDEQKVLLTRTVYLEGASKQFKPLEFVSVESVMNIIKTNSTVRPVPRKRKITDLRNSASWQLIGEKVYPYAYPV